MKNISEIEVSCFESSKTSIPQKSVKLFEWLKSDKHKSLVEKIRNEANLHKQSLMKQQLPCITPSGVFIKRAANGLEKHSGFICIDIDKKDNLNVDNFADLKKLIKQLDCVAYCSLSASGEGYFVLISISKPEKHKEHFESLKLDFKVCGVEVDALCSDVCRLRFASCDEAPYINLNAKPYNKIVPTKAFTVKKINSISDKNKARCDVETLIEDIELHGIDITGKYKDWFAIECSIASHFGESGREYFHTVSQFYHGYNTSETDRQYTACMNDKNEHSIGTLFWYAQQFGIHR